jgi:murein DD-endopeptidase MepM/ murein hydrolase activator NlpD
MIEPGRPGRAAEIGEQAMRIVGWLAACMLLAAGNSVATTTTTAPGEQAERDSVTIDVPTLVVREAQGNEAPILAIAPTAAERRQRARRLSRAPVARERIVNQDRSVTFVLRSLLNAPVTLSIERGHAHGVMVKMLSPLQITIGALKQLEVAKVRSTSVLEPGQAEFIYSAVIGDPAAVHDEGVTYAWPFPAATGAHLSQGPGGPTHKDAFSRFAVDLAVPEGTPVLAARAGVVVFLESRYFESGLDQDKYLTRSNQVRILHDDGSMGSYGHLFPDSINLEPGQRVEVGEQIGLSGNTGFSSGPHLHFVVLVHRNMTMVSVPFRMSGLEL